MLIVLPNADDQCEHLLTERHLAELKQTADFRLFKGSPPTARDYIERVRDADALLLWGGISNEVLAECPNLKFISFAGTGYRTYIDADFAAQRGILVAHAPSYGANAVAEHALGLLMSLAKNIPQYHSRMQRGMWAPHKLNIELEGKIVGLIGLGSIGTKMARLCKALGMSVVCWTRHPSEERASELGITFVPWDNLLAHSDFISLHLPYTDSTAQLIAEREFSLMKAGAFFINTARAELVHHPSLVNALTSGALAGAGIDVFDDEPLSPDNPLLQLDNVVLSPHVGYNTQESIQSILDISVRNLIAYRKGSPVNLVNECQN